MCGLRRNRSLSRSFSFTREGDVTVNDWSSGVPDYSYLLKPNPLVSSIEENRASAFHDRLATWISRFEGELDDSQEVGVRLVSFGQTLVFHLDGIGYWNPSLIRFSGTTNQGQPVELIQHVSQISILLMRLPRLDPSKPRRRIGYGASEE